MTSTGALGWPLAARPGSILEASGQACACCTPRPIQGNWPVRSCRAAAGHLSPRALTVWLARHGPAGPFEPQTCWPDPLACCVQLPAGHVWAGAFGAPAVLRSAGPGGPAAPRPGHRLQGGVPAAHPGRLPASASAGLDLGRCCGMDSHCLPDPCCTCLWLDPLSLPASSAPVPGADSALTGSLARRPSRLACGVCCPPTCETAAFAAGHTRPYPAGSQGDTPQARAKHADQAASGSTACTGLAPIQLQAFHTRTRRRPAWVAHCACGPPAHTLSPQGAS